MVSIIKLISGQQFAIDIDWGLAFLSQLSVNRYLLNDDVLSHFKEIKEKSFYSQMVNLNGTIPNELNDDGSYIAELSISGMMMLEDGLCSYGMKSYANKLRTLNNDPRVKAIYLNMDSGGGQLQAGVELYNAISDMIKPVIIHYHTLGSGAVWGTLPATKIYAKDKTSMIGSIGVYVSISEEIIELLKKDKDIYAETSDNKNKEIRSLVAGDVKPFIKRLNLIDEAFMDKVQQHRDLIYDKDNTLKGGMFQSDDGKRRGLTDDILTRKEVFNRINQIINYEV